jgi:hypothetical protein
MSFTEFKPIPTGGDVEATLEYNNDIGVDTYGLWIIRAAEVPKIVLTTRAYNFNIPMLPTWVYRRSSANFHVRRNIGNGNEVNYNPTGVVPENEMVLP